MFEEIVDFVLGNIGIVVFALFMLSGLFGRGDKKKSEGEPAPAPQQSTRQQGEPDDRPLAERLAEAFGVEIPQEQASPQPQPQSEPQSQWQTQEERYGSEGRRSTERRSVQQEYPQLFGASGLFDRREEEEETSDKWGFDETEWGTTFVENDEEWGSAFEKNESQWGNTFPERKSSEPSIEWPSQFS